MDVIKPIVGHLLVSLVVVLAAWAIWYVATPVSGRTAIVSLLQWGLLAVPVVTAILSVAGVCRRRLRLPAAGFPLMAGLLAVLGIVAAAFVERGLMPVPTSGIVLAVVIAALLRQLSTEIAGDRGR